MCRSGRDGEDAQGILLHTGRHIQHCEHVVKDYCATTDCLREKLHIPFEKAKSDFVTTTHAHS